MAISATPTASIKKPNLMPMMGSTIAKNLELPNPLQILATPVIVRITAIERIQSFIKEALSIEVFLFTKYFKLSLKL